MEGPYIILWRARLRLLGKPCAGVSLFRFSGGAFSAWPFAVRRSRGRAVARLAVFFLVHFSFVRFRERPPERLHARVVIFVTHRRAFDPRHHGENTKRFAFSARACDTATNERTGGLHVSSVITLP